MRTRTLESNVLGNITIDNNTIYFEMVISHRFNIHLQMHKMIRMRIVLYLVSIHANRHVPEQDFKNVEQLLVEGIESMKRKKDINKTFEIIEVHLIYSKAIPVLYLIRSSDSDPLIRA